MAKRISDSKCDKLLEDDEEELEIKRVKEEAADNIVEEAVEQTSTEDHEAALKSQTDETDTMPVTEDTVSETEVSVVETLQESQIVDGVVQDIQVEQLATFSEAAAFQNIIVQHMEITEPLTTLRRLLENRLSCNLSEHEFYLQDSLQLDPTKNLVEQCVQGEGMVQINVEVKSQPGQKPKINIVDILKPAEEQEAPPALQQSQEADHVTRWIVDQFFRREQDRLKIPFDPMEWSESHVKHWILWAIKEFVLEGVDPESFNITGKQLCELQHSEFIRLVPNDRNDVFWTHLELLRKCKFVAVVQQPAPMAVATVTVSSGTPYDVLAAKNMTKFTKVRTSRIIGDGIGSVGNRSGNNGQIQLWQFLLELLTDRSAREIIQWVSDDGEFKLLNPEAVAQMWGERKHKPTMNYEKLSRALRYYYDGDMIAKVHGKRFVYKFVCDLKALLGYSASELNRLVEDSAVKELQKVRDSLRPGMVRKQHVVVDPVKTITVSAEDILAISGRQ